MTHLHDTFAFSENCLTVFEHTWISIPHKVVRPPDIWHAHPPPFLPGVSAVPSLTHNCSRRLISTSTSFFSYSPLEGCMISARIHNLKGANNPKPSGHHLKVAPLWKKRVCTLLQMHADRRGKISILDPQGGPGLQITPVISRSPHGAPTQRRLKRREGAKEGKI